MRKSAEEILMDVYWLAVNGIKADQERQALWDIEAKITSWRLMGLWTAKIKKDFNLEEK